MRITEEILDELKAQAERQSTRKYKWLDVDSRVVLALINEIERSRLVDLRFEVPKHAQLRD